jgi:hypothetical protein
MTLKREGAHSIDLAIDDRQETSLPLYVRIRQVPVPGLKRSRRSCVVATPHTTLTLRVGGAGRQGSPLAAFSCLAPRNDPYSR